MKKFFVISMFVVCPLAFFSCNSQPNQETENISSKKTPVLNAIKKDSFAQPKVQYITATNGPRTVPAGNPVIRAASGFGGNPFFTNYGTEQGLPLSEISCSMADRAGNLWFGTFGAGACRYDGKNFTSYTVDQGLAGNLVYCILEDRAGNLWFGTSGGGVSRYDGRSFTNFTSAEGLANNKVQSMMQDRNGDLWFGTEQGASKFDGKAFINYKSSDGLAGDFISAMAQDKSGSIWFGTAGAGISMYDGKSFHNYTKAQGLADNRITCILADKSDKIWFGTDGAGVIMYDGKKFCDYSKSQGLANNTVYCIIEDKSGNFWFGTDGGGACRYDGKTFWTMTKTQGLASDRVETIVQDKSGSIWFGTIGQGLSRYDGRSFESYGPAQGLEGNQVYSIIQDRSGNHWFGTDVAGISRYDGKRFFNYTKANGLASNFIISMIQDRKGNIWASTAEQGASFFDGKTFNTYAGSQGLTNHAIWCMMQDNAGKIWFGTNGGGAICFDGKCFSTYTSTQGLSSNTVKNILQDKTGDIWFATSGGGVSRYDGKGFRNYTKTEGLAGGNVQCIFQDKSGNIWFGTEGGGVCRFNGNRFINYTTSQGLGDNDINAITEDTIRHILWLGTNLGLSGLRPERLANGDDQSDLFEIFNINTGYPIKDINYNSLFVDNEGILWAGCGDDKLIRFDYDALNKNPAPLLLQILKVKVNSEDICWNGLFPADKKRARADSMALLNEMITSFGKLLPVSVLNGMIKKYGDLRFDSIERFYAVPVNLVVPYQHNHLSFDFVAIEPAKPNQVRYQFKLEGYDKDWSPMSNSTTAVFGNIPEGSYTFRLKALSPYGKWNETEYKFKVLPPWYRTWWAYGFYGLCLLGVLLIIDRVRRNIVIERERAKATEKEIVHAKAIEKAYTELKTTQAQLVQSEKMAALGELTAGIAHEIQNPLNFINNFSEVNKELIEEASQAIKTMDSDDALELLTTLKSNEDKINHHGKRADSIVKGMLQHSKTKSGQKELTNINALADEYLRLSYRGFKAKDYSFEARMPTDFDSSIGTINIIPQDIGKVLLNLYNNAFYAVSEKRKSAPSGYEPVVSVSTRKTGNTITITVKDNGNGIPKNIVDKVFQPFFTTKPTGQGTGLGLSLSYDIVRAHGGELRLDTKEGEYAEFIIQLAD